MLIPYLDRLSNLRILDLSEQGLTYIPQKIFEVSTLSVLKLNNNKLHSLPEDIKNLKQLKLVELHGNRFTDKDIAKLQQLIPQATILYK